MNEKHTFQFASVQCWHPDPSDLPYQKRSKEEGEGNEQRPPVRGHVQVKAAERRKERKQGEGVRKYGNRGDKRLLGECTGETMEHLGVRVQGREAFGSQRFTGQLKLPCFVVISMRLKRDHWLSQPPTPFSHSLFCSLELCDSSFLPQTLPVTLPLTFLPLTLSHFL